MAITVGFISEKGGVGKTTSCYHIAEGLSRFHNKKVLVIDADYQRGGITGRFFPQLIENFGKQDPKGTTLFNKYQQLYSATQQTDDINIIKFNLDIDVIPADPRLSTVSTDKLPSTNNIRSNNAILLQHLRTIRLVLDPIEEKYDYILIDSHPEVSDVMRSIIYASDYCVSPVKLDRQSSIGVATVIGEIANVNEDIEMLRNALNVGDPYQDTIFAGAMGMMAREYAEELKQTEQLEYNRLRQAGDIFEYYVTEGDGLRVAAADRVSVYDVQINNAYKQAGQFKNLTNEFMGVCR
ncbi:ParA family protein [Yersinia ruckeri]|uniref:ParA n=3 Tax=Yersinia ruckeri TaxID=29486 RepID=B6CGX1_YERRU|nr:ParA family protein [Yersinia ruckeri]ABY48109.1 ParA [Yersinia ruckeri]EEP97654.1 ATPase involved in chromosome partitioning-like protein [Yersinia ruckeri ATCC 29473]KGA48444.1 AAA domain protein [Yersinia ruckeri ATCC 29473]MCK8596680.1 ParA family protein [Yersinia ruckeri]MCK8600059.1 ParA family protein [Yersinia ruckeri]